VPDRGQRSTLGWPCGSLARSAESEFHVLWGPFLVPPDAVHHAWSSCRVGRRDSCGSCALQGGLRAPRRQNRFRLREITTTPVQAQGWMDLHCPVAVRLSTVAKKNTVTNASFQELQNPRASDISVRQPWLRDGEPGAGNAQRPLPDAWRRKHGTTHTRRVGPVEASKLETRFVFRTSEGGEAPAAPTTRGR